MLMYNDIFERRTLCPSVKSQTSDNSLDVYNNSFTPLSKKVGVCVRYRFQSLILKKI